MNMHVLLSLKTDIKITEMVKAFSTCKKTKYAEMGKKIKEK